MLWSCRYFKFRSVFQLVPSIRPSLYPAFGVLVFNLKHIPKIIGLGIFFVIAALINQPVMAKGNIGESPQQSFMRHFDSPRISFLQNDDLHMQSSSGRYPFLSSFILDNIFSWTPTGVGKTMSTSCDPEFWRQRIQDARLRSSIQMQGGLMQKYLQDCREELETGKKSAFTNFIDMLSIHFNLQEHPFLGRVVVNLPGNIRLKGLMALKGDLKRRPFVVLRLGIFGNIDDFRAERSWLMMLFEQSPFNVLVLENMANGDFVNQNSQYAFGGYDEGIQNLLVAKILKDPNEPISKLVESLHFVGFSLGGQGVLFSSLLNKYNSASEAPLIQSFLAFCPVINLQPTMAELSKGGLQTSVLDYWSQKRLKGLENKWPGVKLDKKTDFLANSITEVAHHYRGGLSYVSSLVKLPTGMVDSSDFWGLNDFWKYYADVQEPVMIFATQQDPLVSFAQNSQMIETKKLKLMSKNIRVVDFPMGHHCSFSVAYDWKAMTTLIQSYILSHSPRFKLKEKSMNVELFDNEWKEFFRGPVITQFEIQQPGKHQDFVGIRVKLIQREKNKDSRTLNLSLPISDFDFHFLNQEMTSSEKQMIVRWLNQNLKISLNQNLRSALLKITWPVAN